ncbi:hypothetical protein H632_c2714p1 [Helicosporidium sp. ATCC 50920]|nr:hypothetical protein H632_c2714p1 [Helicosporidium sp. ATCC 50920]|eukprot:KDD72935.1 hypothetical protein H632_c2714p1 [Helicosporidium sp. ATCC 50920]
MGDYVNGEPGRPVLLSLLIYLNPEWEPSWGAETRVLDSDSGAGLLVLPRPGRALLMDQDLVHALSPPSAAAGGRPRLSLVWKLALLPEAGTETHPLERPEWGRPGAFGSAAVAERAQRRVRARAEIE